MFMITEIIIIFVTFLRITISEGGKKNDWKSVYTTFD